MRSGIDQNMGRTYQYQLAQIRNRLEASPLLDKEFQQDLADKIFDAETYIDKRIREGKPIVDK